MTPEEFRQAYFEQYSEQGDVCDDAWFHRYFDGSSDWLEVEYRAQDEGFVVYSDPESDVGGYWATTAGGVIEGPFHTMGEVAVSLGYSPRNFPPDSDLDDDDFDDLDDDLDDKVEAEVEAAAPEFDEAFDEDYDEADDDEADDDEADEDDKEDDV